MIDLVKAIRKDSPDAWILNYNPAAIVAPALDQAFPDDKKILNIRNNQPFDGLCKIVGRYRYKA